MEAFTSRYTSALFLCLFTALPGQAGPISWLFDTGSSTTSTSFGTGYGNSWVFTANGISATATAWAVTGSNNTLQNAQIGRYDTGLGVCDRTEGLNCGSPAHQVDNSAQAEFILFQFSAAVDPLSVVVDPYGTYDRDVTYYVGDLADPLNLSGTALTGLSALGFTGTANSDSTASDSPRTVSLTSGFVKSLLIGSRTGSGADAAVDRFKITSLSADMQTQTPEPTTFGLCGVLLLAFGGVLKRRV
jgi:hypothetical protein